MDNKHRIALQIYAPLMLAVGVGFAAGLSHQFRNLLMDFDTELPTLTRVSFALVIPACVLPFLLAVVLYVKRSSDVLALCGALGATLFAVGWPWLTVIAGLLPLLRITTELT